MQEVADPEGNHLLPVETEMSVTKGYVRRKTVQIDAHHMNECSVGKNAEI